MMPVGASVEVEEAANMEECMPIMSIGTIILIILIIALLGGFSGVGGGPFYGTGITAAAAWASTS
jgi:hypothetical protein